MGTAGMTTSRQRWLALRPHVQLFAAEPAGFVAVLSHDGVVALEHGDTKAAALTAMRRRLTGKEKARKRPWLSLCTPCNKRAAAAGDAAHEVGVELCPHCAEAVDRYEKAMRSYTRARKRNRQKARLRRQRCDTRRRAKP